MWFSYELVVVRCWEQYADGSLEKCKGIMMPAAPVQLTIAPLEEHLLEIAPELIHRHWHPTSL